MKNRFIMLLFIITFFLISSSIPSPREKDPGNYIKYYSEYFVSFDGQYYHAADGKKFLFDTLKYSENDPDLYDQIKNKYTGEVCFFQENNPGTIRNEKFFQYVYGSNKKEVERNLVSIRWLPSTINQKVFISGNAGCARALKAVSDELDKREDLRKYLTHRIEGYNWRNIEGSYLLSMHSYGIAVDVCINFSDYWRDHINERYMYRNRIPKDIIQIFERYGFIWGGTWYSYDTMHFEYRPELF